MAMTKQYRSEEDFLQQYNIHNYDIPLVSVDLVIFTLHEDQLKVLLVQRGDYPHKGMWALPGGFVDTGQDQDLRETALRKLREKTSVATPYLEQLESVGGPRRDPRGWSVTVVYFAMIPYQDLKQADAAFEVVSWVSVDAVIGEQLAFDHQELLTRALSRVRSKVLYTLIPAYLIPAPFTLSALQHAYETILGREVEKKAFRRRFDHADVLQPTGEMNNSGSGRPAALYELRSSVAGFNFSRQLSA